MHTDTPAVGAGTWSRREQGLLAVLATTMLIDAVEVSMTVIALPAAGRDLQLAVTSAQWLVTGFALGFGGLLLAGTRMTAALGRRPVYLTALLTFAAASVGILFADDVALLLALRFVKGCCAALTAPTGLAIIATAFPEPGKRDRAMAAYAFAGGSGFASGLVVSGLLTPVIGWRGVLACTAPVAVALAVLGWRLLPHSDRRAAHGSSGWIATVLLTGGSLLLVVAMTAAAGRRWYLAAAVVVLALLVIEQRRSPDPLVRFRLLRNAALARSVAGAALLNGSYLGLLLLMTLQLQEQLGWSPLRTALALLPASAPLVLTSLFSARLIHRFGSAQLIAAGAVPPVAGYGWYLAAGQTPAYPTAILPVTVLLGAGFVLSFAALNAQAAAAAPADRSMAVGLYQTAVQLAAVFVPAAIASLLASAGSRPAAVAVTLLGALGLVPAAAGVIRRRP